MNSPTQKYFVSWSGGKDCSYALYRLRQSQPDAQFHLLHMQRLGDWVAHRITPALMDAQAAAMGLPLSRFLVEHYSDYPQQFQAALAQMREQGITQGIFGDIYLEAHRSWIEAECAKAGISPIFPLWGMERESVLDGFIAAGFKARIISVQNKPGYREQLLGHLLCPQLKQVMQSIENFDICGEQGEYHSIVIDGPIFAHPLTFRIAHPFETDQILAHVLDTPLPSTSPNYPMNKLKPIMFVGTGSDVGKSMLNAGFCRIFKQDGYSPAPFKAQNMSLNSYATADNLEIGRAQAVQAEACGVACHVDMNPVLLKPTTEMCSQVILLGKVLGTKNAKEYFNRQNKATLFVDVKLAFDRISERHNPIVMEGAGSISEMNLWDRDIVNMPMAEYAGAATYLIADIDRGGVFASVYGSIQLLPEHQRKLIKGVIINKFRGDIDLFNDGRKMLQDLCGVPIIGVIPYFRDIFIEQEDSVILDHYKPTVTSADAPRIKISVLLLRSMSNFTDFNQLSFCKNIEFSYSNKPHELEQSDIIIIPGSKNTIADMQDIRNQGLDELLLAHHHAGKPLYGICGGYQIMGESIQDPEQIEGSTPEIRGLGILPISSCIKQGKTTRQCRFESLHDSEVGGRGYEIHSGVSTSSKPLARLDNGEMDGCYLSPSCWGSYIHGIFDNQCVINSILRAAGGQSEDIEDYHEMKERNYDLLATRLRELVDMEQIYASLRQDA